MNRGKKEKWLKTIKKLSREKDDLPSGPRDYRSYANKSFSGLEWVPVDEPKFIGWESHILIGDLSLRRPDAGLLIEAARLAGQSKPTFFTNLNTLKLIRKGKTYNQIMALHREEVRIKKKEKHNWQDSTPEGISNRRGKRFSINNFKKEIPENLQMYFELKEVWIPPTAWQTEGYYNKYYHLGGKFPINDLKVKVKQVYSTHRGIPKSELISRHAEIEEYFTQNLIYNKLWGKSYWESRWEEIQLLKSERKKIKTNLKVAKNLYVPDSWWNPEVLYNVEDTFDKLTAKIRRK